MKITNRASDVMYELLHEYLPSQTLNFLKKRFSRNEILNFFQQEGLTLRKENSNEAWQVKFKYYYGEENVIIGIQLNLNFFRGNCLEVSYVNFFTQRTIVLSPDSQDFYINDLFLKILNFNTFQVRQQE